MPKKRQRSRLNHSQSELNAPAIAGHERKAMSSETTKMSAPCALHCYAATDGLRVARHTFTSYWDVFDEGGMPVTQFGEVVLTKSGKEKTDHSHIVP